MNEIEYIRATNRVKISAALVIVRDVLDGEDFGVTSDELLQIRKLLAAAERKLFRSYSIDE